MAVTTETSESTYTGNAVTVAFATGFRFLNNSEVTVTKALSGASPVTQTEGVHYSLTGAGNDAGGTVTFIVAPAAASTITITRDVPFTQTTAFRTQGAFSPATHENAFDEAAFRDQQLDRRLAVVEAAIAVSDVLTLDGLPVWPDDPTAPVSTAGTGKLRLNDDQLEMSADGGDWRPIGSNVFGLAAFTPGASEVVIDTDAVPAGPCVIHATLQTLDASLTDIPRCLPDPAGGRFTAYGNNVATGSPIFGWSLYR